MPPDNPFIGGSGLSEIWAYGLRNPWRFSFDRITGDLFVADVGETSSLELQGVYFYGDYCSGRIWGAVSQDDGTWRGEELLATGFNIPTFGEDEAGELYVANYHGDQSALYKMVSRAWHRGPSYSAPAADSMTNFNTGHLI